MTRLLFIALIFTSCAKAQMLGVVQHQSLNFTNAVIVNDGNSLTHGYPTYTTGYPTQLAALSPFSFNGAQIYNFGGDGQTTQQMIADAATQVDALYNSAVTNVVVAWEITNTIYRWGGTAQAAVDTFKTYCLARRAAGFKVIVLSTLPRLQTPTNWTGTQADVTAKLDSANTLLAAQWTTFADAYVNVRSDSRLTDANNTTYFTDKIHLTAAGYAIIAEMVWNALLNL